MASLGSGDRLSKELSELPNKQPNRNLPSTLKFLNKQVYIQFLSQEIGIVPKIVYSCLHMLALKLWVLKTCWVLLMCSVQAFPPKIITFKSVILFFMIAGDVDNLLSIVTSLKLNKISYISILHLF